MNGIDGAQLKMLNQMQRMTQMIQADQSGGRSQASWRSVEQSGAFSNYIRQQTDKVVALQKQSSKLKTAFELGDENVSLAEVMIASQKASVSFQAYAETRNKLLSAYQEIMSMQV